MLSDCVATAAALLGDATVRGLQVCGMGIGLAEMVDREGNITSHETIDWRGLKPLAQLSAVTPTVIDSDARAGALAEAIYGRGREFSHSFLYVTVGTGISYCLVLAGQPWTGARGNAIVIANSPMTPVCHACDARSEETLEGFAAGPALIRRYVAEGGIATRGQDVLAAAERGDALARHVVISAAAALGVAIGGLANALDPQAILVGGGLGTAPGLYWQTLVETARSHIWASETRGLPIEQSTLGADTGLLGAAALAKGLAKT